MLSLPEVSEVANFHFMFVRKQMHRRNPAKTSSQARCPNLCSGNNKRLCSGWVFPKQHDWYYFRYQLHNKELYSVFQFWFLLLFYLSISSLEDTHNSHCICFVFWNQDGGIERWCMSLPSTNLEMWKENNGWVTSFALRAQDKQK